MITDIWLIQKCILNIICTYTFQETVITKIDLAFSFMTRLSQAYVRSVTLIVCINCILCSNLNLY